MADWKAGLVAPLFHPTKIWNLHHKTGDRNGPLDSDLSSEGVEE